MYLNILFHLISVLPFDWCFFGFSYGSLSLITQFLLSFLTLIRFSDSEFYFTLWIADGPLYDHKAYTEVNKHIFIQCKGLLANVVVIREIKMLVWMFSVKSIRKNHSTREAFSRIIILRAKNTALLIIISVAMCLLSFCITSLKASSTLSPVGFLLFLTLSLLYFFLFLYIIHS